MRSTINVADSIGCGTSVRLAEYALNVLALRGNATQTSLLVFLFVSDYFFIFWVSLVMVRSRHLHTISRKKFFWYLYVTISEALWIILTDLKRTETGVIVWSICNCFFSSPFSYLNSIWQYLNTGYLITFFSKIINGATLTIPLNKPQIHAINQFFVTFKSSVCVCFFRVKKFCHFDPGQNFGSERK